MNFTDVLLMAFQVVSPALAIALTWVAAKLATFIQAKVRNEYLRGVLVRLDEAVFTAVKDLQQTVVDKIKSTSEDGKISDEDKRDIRDSAIDNVHSYLGPKGLTILMDVLGLTNMTLHRFLVSKVEAAVHDLRLTKGETNSVSHGPGAVGVPFDPLAFKPV